MRAGSNSVRGQRLIFLAILLTGCAVASGKQVNRGELPFVDRPVAESAVVDVETAVEYVPSSSGIGDFSKINYRYLVKAAECAARNSGLFRALHPYEGRLQDVSDVRLRLRLHTVLDESVGFYTQVFASVLTLGIVPWRRSAAHELKLIAFNSKGQRIGAAQSRAIYTKTAGWVSVPILLFDKNADQVLGDTMYQLTLDALAQLNDAGVWNRLRSTRMLDSETP